MTVDGDTNFLLCPGDTDMGLELGYRGQETGLELAW